METSDYWDGFEEALLLAQLEVDKILSTCYNECRTKDALLDVKVELTHIRTMAVYNETIGVGEVSAT